MNVKQNTTKLDKSKGDVKKKISSELQLKLALVYIVCWGFILLYLRMLRFI